MAKKLTKKRGVIAGLALLVITSTLVYVGCGYHRPEKRADRIVKKITKDLDLTEAQQINLEAVKTEFLAKGKEMREAHQDIKNELKAQLSSDTIDQKALLKIYEEHKSKMDEMVFLFTKRLAEFHSTLSPEQKATFIAKLDKLEKTHTRGCCRFK